MSIDLKRDGIRAVGCWESYLNRVRARGPRPEVPERFEWEQSEAFVRGLSERGFNLLITQFSKGHGIEAERPYIDRTRQLVELCHRYDIAVGGYVRYTSLLPESLKFEVPDCLDRFAGRTGAGEYARYGRHYWRYIPCPCSEEWLAYLDRVIEIGVSDVGLDVVHIDGTTLWPEPEACHCERCHSAFVGFLNDRYPDAETRRRRFGLGDVSYIELPYYGHPAAFKAPKAITDPVARDWMRFRCARMTSIYRFLVDATKKRRPDVWVEGNIKYEPGLNTAWVNSNDIFALHQIPGDGFFTEEPNSPELRADGAVMSYIPTFKKARRFGKTIFAYNRAGAPTHAEFSDPDHLSLGYAHQLAFNRDAMGCHVAFNTNGYPAAYEPYVDFHRRHRDVYDSGEIIADVGLYYSTPSLSFDFREPHLQMILAQQALVHERVPFGYVFGEDPADLPAFRAVVLPGVRCLSDAEIASLVDYVKQGGGLVVVGACGVLDDDTCPRRRDGLLDALQLSEHEPGCRVTFGKGRVAVLPRLEPDVAAEIESKKIAPEDWVEDFAKGSPYAYTMWRSARNAEEYLNAVAWAADGFGCRVNAPRGVVCEYVRQEVLGRWLIHLVNFDLAHDACDIKIVMQGQGGRLDAEALTPDACGAAVSVSAEEGSAVISLARLHRYAVVAVRPVPQTDGRRDDCVRPSDAAS